MILNLPDLLGLVDGAFRQLIWLVRKEGKWQRRKEPLVTKVVEGRRES